jgi:ribosomal-protein-alanine N-acetyltransferase
MHRTAAIETARLRIRPYRASDLDDLYRLWTDPDVRRYLWDNEIIPREIAMQALEASITSTREHGFGHWAVCPRESDTLIGFCGFRFLDDTTEIELLYGLAPPHWGKGLATEASRAMLRWGFAEHGFPRVIAITDVPNTASIRVMERLGMTFLERKIHHDLDSVFYVLQHADFAPPAEPFVVVRAGGREQP